MIKIKDSAEFNRLFKALARDVVNSNIHFRLYRDLTNSLHDHPLVFAQSRTFWSLTREAHLHICVYRLCRVYDQNVNALHLKSWLLTIKENLHLFDEAEFRSRLAGNPFVGSLAKDPRRPDQAQLEQDIAACSEKEDPLVKTLRMHRGSQIAHTNARNVVAEKDAGDNHPLKFEHVEELLSRAKTILNRYGSLFAATTYSMQMTGHDDFQYIISCVNDTVRKAREDRLQLKGRPS